ncbi:hypothetical protein KFK09_002772 [Dendrobium nobile]|uniref:Uncharacterized protein n=1 Tax=Dendrobium nobile TaxID=94219 RepID=A0A8T3C863_DENNO|nr:hypothetical protein KFK09_002772 [Dendrobium nobile]
MIFMHYHISKSSIADPSCHISSTTSADTPSALTTIHSCSRGCGFFPTTSRGRISPAYTHDGHICLALHNAVIIHDLILSVIFAKNLTTQLFNVSTHFSLPHIPI